MNQYSIRFFRDPKASGGGGIAINSSTAAKMVSDLLAANIEASKQSVSQTITLNVLSIGDWRPTQGGLARKMVVTDKGNFWVLATAIKNMPKSFLKPIAATAVLTPREVNGTARLNMSSLEFEGLPTETALMIHEMPVGTALFARA